MNMLINDAYRRMLIHSYIVAVNAIQNQTFPWADVTFLHEFEPVRHATMLEF